MQKYAQLIAVYTLIMLLAACAPPHRPALVEKNMSAPPTYMPPDYWKDAEMTAFHEEWYGEILYALNEPSLYERSITHPEEESVRLMVVPSLVMYEYILRVTRSAEGKERIFVKTLHMHSRGYNGKISRNEEFASSGKAINWHAKKLDEIGFWDFPQDKDLTQEDRRSLGGCVDGTNYVVEAMIDGNYKLFEVHECNLDLWPVGSQLKSYIKYMLFDDPVWQVLEEFHQ